MWRRASWHRWAQYAVLLCGLCGDVFAGCLFMSAGVPSEVTWPPPPPQWLPRSPWPPGPQASAVIQASGDARGPVRGTVGEGRRPAGCHRQRCGGGMTGAAASVIATLWTQSGGQTGSGGGHLETVSKLSGVQKRLRVNRPCPLMQTPEKGARGPQGLLCKQVRPQPRSGGQGTVGMQDPIWGISPVRGQVTRNGTYSRWRQQRPLYQLP